MRLIQTVLACTLMLIVTTTLAEKRQKFPICHVDSKNGKINLIMVSDSAKHLGNPHHTYGGISDYEPGDVGASGVDTKDSDRNGVDDGCEPAEPLALCGGSTSKCVFVSSTASNGSLGGLVGADATCQSLADGAGLGGTFKAWLSDLNPGGSVAARFNHSIVPYRLVDGTEIAADWNDLIRLPSSAPGVHLNDFDLTEAGVVADGSFWSGTQADGTALDNYTQPLAHNCAAWTSTTPYGGDTFYNTGGMGVVGRYTEASDGVFRQWSFYNVESCADNLRLLCFEQ